jgi:hypothetical protein
MYYIVNEQEKNVLFKHIREIPLLFIRAFEKAIKGIHDYKNNYNDLLIFKF